MPLRIYAGEHGGRVRVQGDVQESAQQVRQWRPSPRVRPQRHRPPAPAGARVHPRLAAVPVAVGFTARFAVQQVRAIAGKIQMAT